MLAWRELFLPPIESSEPHACKFAEHCFRPDCDQVIVNAFAMREIPFEKADDRALVPKVLRQLDARETKLVFQRRIGVECDDDLAAFPRDPIQIENWSFDIQPLAIRRGGFADRAAPIENAGDANGQKTRIILYAEGCQPPERQCLTRLR